MKDQMSNPGFPGEVRKALAAYTSRWPGKPISELRPTLYCGYRGEPAALEAYLWEVAHSLAQGDDEALPDHVRDCPYCLMRLAQIIQALDATLELEPHPLWQTEAEPAVVGLTVRRFLKFLGEQTYQVAFEGVRAAGEWLSGGEGSWLRLGFAFAWRGGPPSQYAREAEGAEPTAGREVQALAVRRRVGDLEVSATLTAPEGKPELLVRCIRAADGQPPAGRYHARWRADRGPWQEASFGPDACLKLALPWHFEEVAVEVGREGEGLCVVRLEAEAEA